MVPLWDLLNHVTGKRNVRLNHNAEKESLEMIATCSIKQGEEIINSYGDLSNGELLRRHGSWLLSVCCIALHVAVWDW
jgi:SET domain-containing protein 6